MYKNTETIFDEEEDFVPYSSPSSIAINNNNNINEIDHNNNNNNRKKMNDNEIFFTGTKFIQRITKEEWKAFLWNLFFPIFAYYIYCKIHIFMRKYFFEITENEKRICLACFFGCIIGLFVYCSFGLLIFSLLYQPFSIIFCFFCFFSIIVSILYRANVLSLQPDFYK